MLDFSGKTGGEGAYALMIDSISARQKKGLDDFCIFGKLRK